MEHQNHSTENIDGHHKSVNCNGIFYINLDIYSMKNHNIVLTHPQIIKLSNNFLKLGWNLYANVLVETGLKAALVRKRRPIVTARSILVVSQCGFTSFKLSCLLFKLFLSSLDKRKNNTHYYQTYAHG